MTEARESKHIVTLTVTTTSPEHWQTVWSSLSHVAPALGNNVVVSSHEVPTDEEIQDQRHYYETDLFYDENTMLKVYLALMDLGFDRDRANEIIETLQNNGILFRERLLRPAL